MTRLRFTKMEGAGNDFVVVDATQRAFALASTQIRRLADRHRGIGFDQLLVIEAPRRGDTDFYYRIFNADGNEVSQCGNGARCFVRYVHDLRFKGTLEMWVEALEQSLPAMHRVAFEDVTPQVRLLPLQPRSCTFERR